MATVISMFAKKGGVGKSTITYNLAGYLSRLGNRVLLVDADHQNSISQIIFKPEIVEQLPAAQTVAALFDEVEEPDLTSIVRTTTDKNILIAPANDWLQKTAWPDPLERGELQFAFRELVSEVAEDVDYILFDTPPDCANLHSWNCLMASHYVVTAVELEPGSAQSIAGTLRKLDEAVSNGNPNLRSLGFIINRKRKCTLHQGYDDKIRSLYGGQVFSTALPVAVAFSEASHKHVHIYDYAPDSTAAAAHSKISEELLDKMNNVQRRAA